jgi:hypothetical protein
MSAAIIAVIGIADYRGNSNNGELAAEHKQNARGSHGCVLSDSES